MLCFSSGTVNSPESCTCTIWTVLPTLQAATDGSFEYSHDLYTSVDSCGSSSLKTSPVNPEIHFTPCSTNGLGNLSPP